MAFSFINPNEIEHAIDKFNTLSDESYEPRMFLFHSSVPFPDGDTTVYCRDSRMEKYCGLSYSFVTIFTKNEYLGTSLEQNRAFQFLDSMEDGMIVFPFFVTDKDGDDVQLFINAIELNCKMHNLQDSEEEIKVLCDLNQIELNVVEVQNRTPNWF